MFGTLGLILYTYPWLGLAFIPILVFMVSSVIEVTSSADLQVHHLQLLPKILSRAEESGICSSKFRLWQSCRAGMIPQLRHSG